MASTQPRMIGDETRAGRAGGGSVTSGPDRDGVIVQLTRVLDEWRGRIDEVMVRADLADMDVRDGIRARLDVLDNAWLSAKRRLADSPRGLGASATSIYESVEDALAAVKVAYSEVQSVLRRQ